MQDMMGGRIDYICDVISTALPLIRGNSINQGDRLVVAGAQPRALRSRHRP